MVDFKAMISLNETGAFLWEALKEEKEELEGKIADAEKAEAEAEQEDTLKIQAVFFLLFIRSVFSVLFL